MEAVLRCKICVRQYDYGQHAPHVMPCGHTACLQCLKQLADGRCAECRQAFSFPLGKNFNVLDIMEAHAKEALTRRLEGVLPPGVQDQCSGEQALQALSLLQRDWELTLRGGERALTGTLRGGEDGDPLAAALCLLVATRTQLREENNVVANPQPARGPLATGLLQPPGGPTQSVTPPQPVGPPARPSERPPVEQQPGAAQPLREEDVGYFCRLDIFGHQLAARAAVLERVLRHGVLSLKNVSCSRPDPRWSLDLLRCAAPTLEGLHVEGLRDAHLLAIHDMPRLRRLEARFFDAEAAPLALPALPPGHRGLRWLSVRDFPSGTLLSLLRAHSGTLEGLELSSNADPDTCRVWPALLATCALPSLGRLLLKRVRFHEGEACDEECAALRRLLTGVQVSCSLCDGSDA